MHWGEGEEAGGPRFEEAEVALQGCGAVMDQDADDLQIRVGEGGAPEARKGTGEADADDEARDCAGGADREVNCLRVGDVAIPDLLGKLQGSGDLPQEPGDAVAASVEDL